LVKSPQVSEPNISASQPPADRCAPLTVTFPLLIVRPSAQSLLTTSASSLDASVMLVILTPVALITFQPSRSLAVAIVSWSALSFGLASGASYPEPLPSDVAPESSRMVTLLIR